ncbi:MAG: hypothetical protein ABS79_05070 [Planctomycetes bacterium SCN 63-9]|mgnify:CR=1 FL=1|nr:MAG: hypothetical protein ABS79_05070 [Planctomycetes bacterium SCN 63-9]
MSYLVDTNILSRLAEPGHAMHRPASDAVKFLTRQGYKLHIVPQNLYEFWVISTRPTSANGLGKSAADTLADLGELKRVFHWLDDVAAIYGAWERLVSGKPVLGKNAHDARLVAAMRVHGLTHLLTFNDEDFRNYPGITAVTPSMVLPDGPV